MHRRTAACYALALTMTLVVTGCASSSSTPKNLAQVSAATPQLHTFNQLIQEAGLSAALQDDKQALTVFAPSDEAFKAVPSKTLESLKADKAQLKAVLSYHIVAGRTLATDIKPANTKTLQGANVALSKAGTFVTVEDAMVEKADLVASNGVIHIVDRVLMPPKK